MDEVLVPEGAVHERLGISKPRLVKTRTVRMQKLNALGNTWVRRDQLLGLLRIEYEATEDPVIGKLIKVIEEI